jgi:AmmeMemoRadiSam system protein B
MRVFGFSVFAFWFWGMKAQYVKLRPLADTVGFAHTALQMNVFMDRVRQTQSDTLVKKRKTAGVDEQTVWKTVITPHDDYTYCGYMYPLALENIKAKTVILFGVAHKARTLHLENKMIFDSYTHWRGPYGNVEVSSLRNDILSQLPANTFEVNDSMQKIEHSVEAEIPFLQYYNKNIEIVSILAPPMNYEKINELAAHLAKAIGFVMKTKNLKWGNDIAFVISADAVHYGDEEWSGRNFAFYGADEAGYKKAVKHEWEILSNCMNGSLDASKVKLFTEYTVKKEDHKDYKWTWCGRYSVPLGLQTSFYLANELKIFPFEGKPLGYSTSLENKPIDVKDLGSMGTTAVATIHHWVGYAAVGFK